MISVSRHHNTSPWFFKPFVGYLFRGDDIQDGRIGMEVSPWCSPLYGVIICAPVAYSEGRQHLQFVSSGVGADDLATIGQRRSLAVNGPMMINQPPISLCLSDLTQLTFRHESRSYLLQMLAAAVFSHPPSFVVTASIILEPNTKCSTLLVDKLSPLICKYLLTPINGQFCGHFGCGLFYSWQF